VVADVAATSDWRLMLACLLLVATIVATDQSHPLLLCDCSSNKIVAADSLPVATVSCDLWLQRLIVVETVKFLGYCYDTTIESVEFYGQIAAERIHRALCFEYLHNGSLASYLRGMSTLLSMWHSSSLYMKSL
jgi:hypothetical protein